MIPYTGDAVQLAEYARHGLVYVVGALLGVGLAVN